MGNIYANGRTSQERFWSRVVEGDGCWEWTGKLSRDGYGRIKARRMVRVHRYAYELLVGPIPAGLTIDHLCRNRGCVNPAHMEPVTNRENVLRGVGRTARQARQAHCKRGHPLSGSMLIANADGFRSCRLCNRIRAFKYRAVARQERLRKRTLEGMP